LKDNKQTTTNQIMAIKAVVITLSIVHNS